MMMTIKKAWISAALIPALSMWVAISACSGDSSEAATGDVDDYCASVEDADEICGSDGASAKPSGATPGTQQSDSQSKPFHHNAADATGHVGYPQSSPGGAANHAPVIMPI